MTIVERESLTHPPLVWGRDIRVEVCADRLVVSAVVAISEADSAAAPDIFRAYRRSVSRFGPQKREGKNSPHIQFANADTDQKLIRFVQQFGPVVAGFLKIGERIMDSGGPFYLPMSESVLVAHQDLAELRNERQVYRAALSLVSELRRGKEHDVQTIQLGIHEIVQKVFDWPSQWERERRLRMNAQGRTHQPLWVFGQDNLRHLEIWKYTATLEKSDQRRITLFGGPDPIGAGHQVICELVNAFSPLVYAWGETPVEAPHWDLAGGIRPVLYHILREQYLQGSGIAVCRNTECRELFEIERAGQEFCGDLCSRHHRQREYWNYRGKKLRKRRLKRQKSAGSRNSRHSYSGRKRKESEL